MDTHYIERIFTSSYWYHAVLSIIVPIIFIIVFFLALSYAEESRGILSLIACFVSGVLLLGSCVGLICWRSVRADSVECEERYPTRILQDTKLYSLANGTKVESQGSIGAFGGNFVISSADTYRYYYKEGERIRQSSVPVSSTYIEYITDKNIAPHLSKIQSWKQIVCQYNGEERIWNYESITNTYYILYVPEGSVVESFELN